MTIETTRDNFCINQIVEHKKDSFIVESDAIIPDIKPDILNTINTSGTICIYKKEIQDGKIKIDGTINVYAMYYTDSDSGNIRSINTNMDFSKIIDVQSASKDMCLDIALSLKDLECKIINERKISLKASISYDLKIISKENVNIIKGVANCKDIQILNDNLTIYTLAGEGTAKAYAKDTLNIDNNDKIAEILKSDIKIINKETKLSYNKVLMKADVKIKLLYLTEDNNIKTIERTIPIMGFIDVKDVKDNDYCYVNYEIKNILIKPNNNGDDNSIYIEIETEISCKIYEEKNINVIQDMYSPTVDLKCDSKRINMMNKKNCIKDVCNIREKQTIKEIGSSKIYDVDIIPSILNQNVLNDKIIYEGELWLNLIFESNMTGGIDSKKIYLPFNFEMNINESIATSNINTSIEVRKDEFIVLPDESLEINADLIFIVEYSNNLDINIIDNIESSDNQSGERYSMIVYFTKQNDDLWQIAKKYKSTIDDIIRINGIEKDQKLNTGKQLFIPRYNG